MFRRSVGRLVVALAVLCTCPGARASAQLIPDARTVPAGALRISFTPRYVSWNEVFDTAGTVRRLGYHYLTDSSAHLFPGTGTAEGAVRSLTGDASWVLRAGQLDPRLDADVRHFPFDFSLGVTSWLTIRAMVPVVTTTMNAFPVLDTAGVNAGRSTFTTVEAQAIAADLTAAADQLGLAIAAGQFGCPGGSQCALAQSTETRARVVATDLLALASAPLQPLAQSAAGQAITASLGQLNTDLQALGVTPAGAVTLPSTSLDSAGLAGITDDLGLSPLAPSKHTRRLGDVELGARVALANRPGLRLLADVTFRLPTAARGRALDPIDLPPGDRQLDIAMALEGALEGGRLSLWMRTAVEIQRPGTFDALVTSPDAPLAPASAVASVTRDPGDMLQISVWPTMRLTDDLRVLFTADWHRRGADRVTASGIAVPALEAETGQTSLAFGGGIWYRSARGRHVDALPIEAGLVYRTVFTGTGGLTPRSRQLDFGLRLYYGL